MDREILKEARSRVNKKKGFYTHMAVFFAVGMFFLLMNLATWNEEKTVWFFFPLIPWSIAVFIHYFLVFGLPGSRRILTSDWEKRELEREIYKLSREKKDMLIPGKSEFRNEEEEMELKELDKLRRKWEDEDLV